MLNCRLECRPQSPCQARSSFKSTALGLVPARGNDAGSRPPGSSPLVRTRVMLAQSACTEPALRELRVAAYGEDHLVIPLFDQLSAIFHSPPPYNHPPISPALPVSSANRTTRTTMHGTRGAPLQICTRPHPAVLLSCTQLHIPFAMHASGMQVSSVSCVQCRDVSAALAQTRHAPRIPTR